jgi:hypothetical protein
MLLGDDSRLHLWNRPVKEALEVPAKIPWSSVASGQNAVSTSSPVKPIDAAGVASQHISDALAIDQLSKCKPRVPRLVRGAIGLRKRDWYLVHVGRPCWRAPAA